MLGKFYKNYQSVKDCLCKCVEVHMLSNVIKSSKINDIKYSFQNTVIINPWMIN